MGAGYFLFLSALILTKHRLTSVWLTAVFVLTPVMQAIDLSRVDHLVMALLVFCNYCVINILTNQERTKVPIPAERVFGIAGEHKIIIRSLSQPSRARVGFIAVGKQK